MTGGYSIILAECRLWICCALHQGRNRCVAPPLALHAVDQELAGTPIHVERMASHGESCFGNTVCEYNDRKGNFGRHGVSVWRAHMIHRVEPTKARDHAIRDCKQGLNNEMALLTLPGGSLMLPVIPATNVVRKALRRKCLFSLTTDLSEVIGVEGDINGAEDMKQQSKIYPCLQKTRSIPRSSATQVTVPELIGGPVQSLRSRYVSKSSPSYISVQT